MCVRKGEVMTDNEALAARIWHQVEHGVDLDLLPSREKRTKDLAKKLDRNGWRMFVSGCAYTMAGSGGGFVVGACGRSAPHRRSRA